MGRKGKAQKHTAKEIAGKHAAAKAKAGGAGGGGDAAKERQSKGAKVAVKCKICLGQQPNLKSMEAHYDGKHSKINWKEFEATYETEFNVLRAPSRGGKGGSARARASPRRSGSPPPLLAASAHATSTDHTAAPQSNKAGFRDAAAAKKAKGSKVDASKIGTKKAKGRKVSGPNPVPAQMRACCLCTARCGLALLTTPLRSDGARFARASASEEVLGIAA